MSDHPLSTMDELASDPPPELTVAASSRPWHWAGRLTADSQEKAEDRGQKNGPPGTCLTGLVEDEEAITSEELCQEAEDRRPAVRRLLALEFDDSELDAIRELWKSHSKAEDDRDIAGLLATLTEDCIYEVMGSGHRWEGHEGAARFYGGLLDAFPDIDFSLTNIFIGPQGVCEEAVVTGTHQGEWLGQEASGETVVFRVVIFFPWDAERRLFAGERVYAFFPSDALLPAWAAAGSPTFS